MSPDEIRVILEACEKTGVSEIEFGDLWVSFGRKTQEDGVRGSESATQPKQFWSPPPPTTEIVGIQENIALKALEDAEIALKEDQIAELAIEDPVELERMIRDGEITDELIGSVEEA